LSRLFNDPPLTLSFVPRISGVSTPNKRMDI
jgi:hypothetical protein